MATNSSSGNDPSFAMSELFLFYSKNVFATLHILLFFLGMSGNVLLLLVLILSLRRKSGSHIARLMEPLLINIASLDLIFFLYNFPVMLGNIMFKDWHLGYLFCVTHHSLSLWITFADFYSMLAVSLLRYTAVIHPVHMVLISPRQISLACIFIWLVCLLFSIPVWLHYGIIEVEREIFCVSHMASTDLNLYLQLLGGVGFLPALLIMIFCYSRIISTLRVRRILSIHTAASLHANWRATMMALVTMVALVVMSLPYWLMVFFARNDQVLTTAPMYLAYHLTSFLAFANHCINPVICFCLSFQFQARLRNLFRRAGKGIRQLGLSHVGRTEADEGK
ncbi:urotensin-2 receptor-like [Heteronotia binoei]|uniref:urotensin-2 receptor-like n=1 Tax=Heteronotia binoei TaxID=13085 RepID=UPI002931912A|nr:urotensin-2 receptor-like [Heteronotia binoei]